MGDTDAAGLLQQAGDADPGTDVVVAGRYEHQRRLAKELGADRVVDAGRGRKHRYLACPRYDAASVDRVPRPSPARVPESPIGCHSGHRARLHRPLWASVGCEGQGTSPLDT